jgi:hypothetical protein
MSEDFELQRNRGVLSAHIRKTALNRIEELKRLYGNRPYPVEVRGKTINTTFDAARLALDSPQPDNIEIHLRVPPETTIDDLCSVPNEVGETCFGVARTIEPEDDVDGIKRVIILSALAPSPSRNPSPRKPVYSPKIGL